jgi:hypothetical protein
MVNGFLGTVIGMERAVALKRPWAYGTPLAAGLSGIALLLGFPAPLTHALAAAGGLFLVAIFVVLYRRQPTGFLATMGLGALLWLAGNVLFALGYALFQVAPWWIGFLVVTIAGERLELTRLIPRAAGNRIGFVLAISVVLLGLLISLFTFPTGIRLSGLGLVALALWLLSYDLAWRTLERGGLARFMAVSLLSGYVWLAVGGGLWMLAGDRFVAGFAYDAMLHAILLGFVFSMIFGHAPVIVPALLGIDLAFMRDFYLHLGLLHLSVALRVGGDLSGSAPAQQWGGLLNVLAILLFLANTLRAEMAGERQRRGLKR